MLKVAVIGAGAGGAAAAVELTLAGHEVTLWNRSPATLDPFLKIGGIEYEGVLGDGFVKPKLITADLAIAIKDVDVVLVCLPTFSHASVARSLAELELRDVPVVLNPGHTGGALEFRHAFQSIKPVAPPIAEFSTLTYVARKKLPQRVTVSGRAKQVRVAALPGGRAALAAAKILFPGVLQVSNVLASDLANVNMVLHPPGCVLGSAWVEATGGDFTFYVDGMTPGVARIMQALDDERRAVAHALGHDLPPLIGEMQAIGTVEASVTDQYDLAGGIAGGEANKKIMAPDTLSHRYYLEDFGHGLVPFIAIAAAAGVSVPIAQALLKLGEGLTGVDYSTTGRTAERMGIAGLDRRGLLALVTGPEH